jgi:membrane-associated protease RseP (regulator of RpoE activity)
LKKCHEHVSRYRECQDVSDKEKTMNRKFRHIPVSLGLAFLWIYGVGVGAAENTMPQAPRIQEENGRDAPNGVIGVSLHVGAERVGDPAVLYVGMVHPEGPAHEAGLAEGDEITAVNGVDVSGKTYEQLVKMIRGTAGSAVKLSVKGEAGMREVSIPRVPSESLAKGPGPAGKYGTPSR